MPRSGRQSASSCPADDALAINVLGDNHAFQGSNVLDDVGSSRGPAQQGLGVVRRVQVLGHPAWRGTGAGSGCVRAALSWCAPLAHAPTRGRAACCSLTLLAVGQQRRSTLGATNLSHSCGGRGRVALAVWAARNRARSCTRGRKTIHHRHKQGMRCGASGPITIKPYRLSRPRECTVCRTEAALCEPTLRAWMRETHLIRGCCIVMVSWTPI